MCNVESSTMDMNELPDEIWTEILKRMAAKERKQFRIACRRWMDYCNCRDVEKIEKLHLPGVCQSHDIVDTLLSSKRSILNLKFSNHRLESLDNWNIWRTLGQKIEQLELEYSTITLPFMEEILLHCKKLSKLALKNVLIVHGAGSLRSFHDTFTEINQHKIVAPSVKTLALNVHEICTLTGLSSLTSIFPNLKNLELNPYISKREQKLELKLIRTCAYNSNDNIYSCQKFLQCLATNLLQLEYLTVNTLSERCQCNKYIQKTQFCRLESARFYNNQELTYVNENDIYFPRIYTFIVSSHFKDITSIEFFWDAKVKDIINVLQEITSLRKMKVSLSPVNDFDELTKLYRSFANSKLVCLNVWNKFEPNWRQSLSEMLQESCLPTNSTVRELKIMDQSRENVFLSLFLKCFSGLTHLRLKMTTKNFDIANIFHQTKLKCIELKSRRLSAEDVATLKASNATPDTFGKSNYIDLEYLRIEIGILKEIYAQQQTIFFSNLQHLHIASLGSWYKFDEQLPLELLETSCINLSNLESVFMTVDGHVSDIFTFFARPCDFPKIQYIGIKIQSCNVSNKTKLVDFKKWFESWFEHCSSLKTIFLEHEGYGLCLCHDSIQGKVREYQPEETIKNSIVDSYTGVTIFNYYKNLKSFYNFWDQHS